MLETGRYATIKEIAKAEKINSSYASRVLRLTLLAPKIVEAIYRFANCMLDTEKQELLRVGQLVPLEPQVFDLLTCQGGDSVRWGSPCRSIDGTTIRSCL